MRNFKTSYVIMEDGRKVYAVENNVFFPLADKVKASAKVKELIALQCVGAWRIPLEAIQATDSRFGIFYWRYFPGKPEDYENAREE